MNHGMCVGNIYVGIVDIANQANSEAAARAQSRATRPARTRRALLYNGVEQCAEPQQPGASCQDLPFLCFLTGVFPLDPRSDDFLDEDESDFRVPFDEEELDRGLDELLFEDDGDLPLPLLRAGDGERCLPWDNAFFLCSSVTCLPSWENGQLGLSHLPVRIFV